MVGNKHKNGIICTFPNCNKPMRTQKFKMHFTRAHLKDGEVYSVDHRRQYEVAREENARSAVKHELVPVAAAPAMPTVISTATEGETPREETTIPATANASRENVQVAQVRQQTPVQSQQMPLLSHVEASVTSTTKSEDSAVNASAGTLQFVTMAPMSGQIPLSGEQTSGSKRSASAMEAFTETVDPTSVLLMQFIALMDQRFQELVGKMGEMIDVQKDLIDTLQASNPNGQAPASAFSHAVDVVMKRRKRDTSPRDNNNDSDEVNGNSNADTDASGGSQGPPSSGFVL